MNRILKRLEKCASTFPNKFAYIVDDNTINYGDFWKEVSIYSSCLSREGTGPVVIYGHRSISMLVAIFACIYAKRVYIPIDISVPVKRMEKIIEITKPTLLIMNENVMINNIKSVKLDDLLLYFNHKIKNQNNSLAYIMFTSGSTGQPKGVPISYANLNNFIKWISNFSTFKKMENVNIFNQANFNFDLSVAGIFLAICNGHTLVSNNNEIVNYTHFFKNKNINIAILTPTFMKLCLLDQDFNIQNIPNFQCIYFCGEVLDTNLVKKVWERFPNISIINAYGPTEATSAVSAVKITKEMLYWDLLPVGFCNSFASDVFIKKGEIIIKGKSVFGGYLNNVATGFYKDKNINCYCTGDLGFFKDNYLFCKGRNDNQVKYKGYRIELSEIEYYIKQISEVIDCVVVPKCNNLGVIKFLKAFVVSYNAISDKTIKDYLKTYLPYYMIPNNIVFLKEIPVNNNGKVDRKKLNEL